MERASLFIHIHGVNHYSAWKHNAQQLGQALADYLRGRLHQHEFEVYRLAHGGQPRTQ
ncbi:MAG: hypothetical protein JO166_21055 [Deltaproteobacteria bacterium]|nr:hypothetical protein [Deltaproteobacteria bacterium]